MIYINPYLSVPINTIIGGVASSISSKSALATKLGISESLIRRFEIIGSDVHARISGSYSIPNYAFQNNTTITSYLDIDGYCFNVGTNAFAGSSLINAKIENAVLQSNAFLNTTSFNNVFNSGVFVTHYVGSLGYTNTFNNTRFKVFKCDNMSVFSGSYLANNSLLEEVIGGLLTVLGTQCLIRCSKLKKIPQTITDIGNNALQYCGIEDFIQPNLTIFGVAPIFGCTYLKTIIIDALEDIPTSNNAFANLTSCELISMKKLKNYGNASGGTVAVMGFNNLKSGCEIRVNIALATANSGSPHAALLWVKANRSAIVEFYDDNGNYVSTL